MGLRKTFLFFILVIILLETASAHLETGRDISKDGYIIDFGWTPSEVTVNQPVSFGINFVNESTEIPVNITSCFVRILDGNNILFAGEFLPNNASTTFSYTFSKAGNYTLDTKFENNGVILEEQSVYLKVSDDKTNYNLIIELSLSLIILVLLVLLLRKKNVRTKN